MSHSGPAHRLPAFTDIIGLFPRWLPIENSRINAVDNPFPFPLTTMGERPETRSIWRSVLKKQEATLSDVCKQVLQFYESWEQEDPQAFKRYYRIYPREAWMAFFKDAFDKTSSYFAPIISSNEYMKRSFYKQIVSCHITVNAHSLQQAEENIKTGLNKTRDSNSLPPDQDPIFTERAYIYAENVPKFVETMKKKKGPYGGFADNLAYEDLWWMMMMRLHAWTMSVRWEDRGGVKISSEYYNNPARVYIL
jgi:hypothetical protein